MIEQRTICTKKHEARKQGNCTNWEEKVMIEQRTLCTKKPCEQWSGFERKLDAMVIFISVFTALETKQNKSKSTQSICLSSYYQVFAKRPRPP